MNSTVQTAESISLSRFLDMAYQITNWGTRFLEDAQPSTEPAKYGKLTRVPERIYIGRSPDKTFIGVYRHQAESGPEYSMHVASGDRKNTIDFPESNDKYEEDKIRLLYEHIKIHLSQEQPLKLTT